MSDVVDINESKSVVDTDKSKDITLQEALDKNSSINKANIDLSDINLSDKLSDNESSNKLIKRIIESDCNTFWSNLKRDWNNIYPLLVVGDKYMLKLLNLYLSARLAKYLDISFSFNEINRQNLDSYQGHIELYISPKFKKDNIEYMLRLYNAKVELPNCSVACYSAYHPNDELLSDDEFAEYCEDCDYFKFKDEQVPLTSLIPSTTSTTTTTPDNTTTTPVHNNTHKTYRPKYEDFGFQGHLGRDENNKPNINITVLVKQPIASKILKIENVKFKHTDGSINSRDVWFSKHKVDPITILLSNIIGEYNLVNHVGYIEYLPEDDPLISKDSVFTELLDCRKSLDIILKHRDYKSCAYCSHLELQTCVSICSRCKSAHYCSKLCQKSHWNTHKQTCVAK